MKMQFLNLGKALSKAEQRQINGGYEPKACASNIDCNNGEMICTDVDGQKLCMYG